MQLKERKLGIVLKIGLKGFDACEKMDFQYFILGVCRLWLRLLV